MSNDQLQSLLEQVRKHVEYARQTKVTFLLLGQTGVGKSSTINRLLGQAAARVGHYQPTTVSIEPFESEIEGFPFVVVDTPGLCDDEADIGNDDKYLSLIKSNLPQVDCLFFVTRLDFTRVSSDEKRGIRLISRALGAKVWRHSLIIFTFANNIQSDRFSEALFVRTSLIRKEIAQYTGDNTANEVPSIAVDNTSDMTPDGKSWLSELYVEVFTRISKEGLLPFLLSTKGRLVEESKSEDSEPHADPSHIILSEQHIERLEKRVHASEVGMLIAAGSAIGIVFGPVGAAVGGALGATLGILLWATSKYSHQ